MTYEELNQLFAAQSTKPTHLIAWAARKGVKIYPATISRHRAGTQLITAPWELTYRWYFQTINSSKI